MRKIIFPLILGAGGVAVLVWLGFWQLERLYWKQDVLAEIDARISDAPVALPESATKSADNYSPVTFVGSAVGDEIHVLVSGTAAGTGYRAITAVETEGRRILLDQGLLPLETKADERAPVQTEITGNLIWPDDQNDSTPAPDLGKNIWFARNVDTMAAALNTEPLMVVARTMTPADPRLTPLPVDTAGIKNDHFEYAITWFLLATVWAAMTAFLIRRTTRQKDA